MTDYFSELALEFDRLKDNAEYRKQQGFLGDENTVRHLKKLLMSLKGGSRKQISQYFKILADEVSSKSRLWQLFKDCNDNASDE